MLTIGQLANYAGVTVKAVRHYHRRGLLQEPPRDSSGYRRYGAQHAIDLVKIRTLAAAGVPLGRVKELLTADRDSFGAAVAAIDRQLQERIEHLVRARERIAQLSAGDRLFVSPEVADYLDRLREIGVSQRAVQLERDVWILVHAVWPREAATWIADKRDAIGDPEFRAIYLEHDAAFDWPADDARLGALADRTRRWMAKRSGGSPGGTRSVPAPTFARLAATFAGARSPAWDHLAEIAKEGEAGRGVRDSRPSDARPASPRMDAATATHPPSCTI